jgi:hypothetical protein
MEWAGGAASPKRVLKRLSASVSRYPVRLDRGHFSSIGGSCHEEEESLVPSDVVDFSIVARQRVHYRAGPESCTLSGVFGKDRMMFTVSWMNFGLGLELVDGNPFLSSIRIRERPACGSGSTL